MTEGGPKRPPSSQCGTLILSSVSKFLLAENQVRATHKTERNDKRIKCKNATTLNRTTSNQVAVQLTPQQCACEAPLLACTPSGEGSADITPDNLNSPVILRPPTNSLSLWRNQESGYYLLTITIIYKSRQ